jgi:hypothetical protein
MSTTASSTLLLPFQRACSDSPTPMGVRLGILIRRRAPGQIALREPHHLALEITARTVQPIESVDDRLPTLESPTPKAAR